MPAIGEIKNYAVGFWQSQSCDNSLAQFPSGSDFSWGNLGFEIDGTDADNYATLLVINDLTGQTLKEIRFDTNGKKTVDLSQYSNIPSTQDLKIVMQITSYI